MASLVFKMDLPDSARNALVPGKLLVLNNSGTLIDSYNATSGAPRCQYKTSQHRRGVGPLPECRKLGITSYSVPTRGYYLGTPGVRGNFYHITPDPVAIRGVRRGEFGIHWDANWPRSPGSAGCIVMTGKDGKTEFARFEKLMSNLRSQGISKLPLIVAYNQGSVPIITPPRSKYFTVEQPKPGQILDIEKPITFSGTAKPEVSTIIVLVGPPEGHFKIKHLRQVENTWTFNQTFNTKGVNRPLRFRAFDAEGNHLEDIKFNFTLQ